MLQKESGRDDAMFKPGDKLEIDQHGNMVKLSESSASASVANETRLREAEVKTWMDLGLTKAAAEAVVAREGR